MSTIPTCAVRAVIRDAIGGQPIQGALIVATLSAFDVYLGYVVPQEVEATTDAEGVAILHLWPNVLGTAESFYKVRIEANDKTLRTTCVVPNIDEVDLHTIAAYPDAPAELPVPSPFSPATGSETFVAGTARTAALATILNGGIATGIASVTPPLPAGLTASIVENALQISGTAAAQADGADYVIVANLESGGRISFTLSLTVNAAPAFNPASDGATFVAGAAQSTTIATVVNGVATDIASVTPPLPTGLTASIVSNGLQIAGTAADEVATTDYVIVANLSDGGTISFTLSLTVDPVPDRLARWKAGGISGKKITFWGDSTTELAGSMWQLLAEELTLPLADLAGVEFVNKGSNGQTMAGANDQMTADVYATNPDLIVLCFGINDVRQGGVNAAQLAARLTTAVVGIRTNLPNCDIVLWTPNPILSVDSTGVWVIPESAAQAYTDVMWNAYNSLKDTWPNVKVVDKMEVFGRTSTPTHPFMDDTLHPNAFGQRAAVKALLPHIVPATPAIDLTASAAAWASNPNNPWTVYDRALEDTRFCELVRPFHCGLYMNLDGNLLMYWAAMTLDDNGVLDPASFRPGDFVQTVAGVYLKGSNGDFTVYNDTGVQVYNIPTSSFPVVSAPTNMRHYRRL